MGFTPVAEGLARIISDQSANDGLVFGIDGKWGSGKSTLINLTIDALLHFGNAAPEVINFSPWLVGNRESLLVDLFDELVAAAIKIDRVELPATENDNNLARRNWRGWCVRRNQHSKLKRQEQFKKTIGAKLKAYSRIAGRVGQGIKLLEFAGVPYAGAAGAAIQQSGDSASGLLEAASITKQKAELVDALKLLSRRIVVFVDDLDRLDRNETSEMLRLIRAVADFPNVIYVMSYDPDIVANKLNDAFGGSDGAEFLEKIVQVSFRVPRPEAFDLRRWFEAEIRLLFSEELGTWGEKDRLKQQRLAEAIDVQGGRHLRTPRDVVRTLNALRLHALPVRQWIDVPDMVWLQLVRIGNEAFYAWIEEYLVEVAAMANGAMITSEHALAMETKLVDILKTENLGLDRAAFELAQFLPAIGTIGGNLAGAQRQQRLFRDLHRDNIDSLVASRRIGSPQHYRYYFAFVQPSGALTDEEVLAFVSLAEHRPNDALQLIANLAAKSRPQGGTMAEVLIDRLVSWTERIPPAAIPGIFEALADVLDDAARISPPVDFGEIKIWYLAERAVGRLLKRISQRERETCLSSMFEQGRALGWLSRILRSEIFRHGHYGQRAEPEDQWLLSASEFSAILSAMLKRYRETKAEEMMNVPMLLSLLFTWHQGSGTDEARKWVGEQIQSDSGLLALLRHLRSWVSSSSIGVYYPLQKNNLEVFLDYDDAVRRVRGISESESVTEDERRLATELNIAFEQGRSQ